MRTPLGVLPQHGCGCSSIIHEYSVDDSSCRRSLLLLLLVARSTRWQRRLYLDLEAETSHAGAVLVYRRHAVLLGVIGLGEKHAIIALGLLFLAHAAGLFFFNDFFCLVFVSQYCRLRTAFGELAGSSGVGGAPWASREHHWKGSQFAPERRQGWRRKL